MTSGPDQNQPHGRRGNDRRQRELADLPFPDRRKGERRSGTDRRGSPRS